MATRFITQAGLIWGLIVQKCQEQESIRVGCVQPAILVPGWGVSLTPPEADSLDAAPPPPPEPDLTFPQLRLHEVKIENFGKKNRAT